MEKLNTHKEMLLTLITNSTLLKICFGYSSTLWFASVISPDSSPLSGFIEYMLNSMPSKVAGYLGIIFGAAMVWKKISEAWKSHKLNVYEVRMKRESWRQKKAETDRLLNEKN